MATKTIKKLKRLAASLIVLRQKNSAIPGDKFEILLVQRSRTMKFATSTWVFPGGVYDKADGDGVEDNLDYYPYNPYKTTDDWGQIVDQYPSVYAASDITEINRKGLEDDLRLAADYFGKYEVEWWAVGREIDAMLELASDWCDRRIERGQLW